MKFDTVKSVLLIGGVFYVGYKVYKAQKVVSDSVDSVNDVRLSVGQSIGVGVYDFFHDKPKLN